jgi:Cu2+-exporting ATPase
MSAIATPSDLTVSNAPASAAADVVGVDDAVEQARFTRWVTGPQGERLGESALQLTGMYCAACAGLIEQAVAAVPGVRSVQVGAAAQRATVRWDPAQTRPSALIQAIRAAGYGAVPDAAAPARLQRRAEHSTALWRLFVAAFCAMQVMMMATPSYVAGPGELADDLRQLLNWGCWLMSLPVMVFSATPFFTSAWRSLRARRIGMDVPVSVALLITFVASTGATFDPAGIFGHEVYFDSLTMFVSFLLGARYLELRARHRAAETLEASLSGLPEMAVRVAEGGALETVNVHHLRAGDEVRVAVGQAFPADGLLLAGSTRADESLLSGESAPVDKAAGAELVAGSLNLGSPVAMRVQRVGGDTRLEAIVSMMRSAMSQRPASAALADRWAGPFLWAVLLLAAGAAAVWSVIDPSRAVWVAVAVLIVTCPCALSLAAPAVLVAAARGLSRHGVMLQKLDALEVLAKVRHVFFDKTGTLSETRVRLAGTGLTPAGRALLRDEPTALAQAAGLAGWSAHPVAAALAAAVAPASVAWTSVHEHAGQGLEARDEQGRRWQLGSARFVGAAHPGVGEGAVWLACEGQPLAGFELADEPRPGAREAVQALRAQGLRVTLLSGDTPARAQALADALGLDDVVAGATPETKLAVVAAAQARGGRVAMVGDGINDAPVLARADVSLAMGQGALVARSSADAVVMSNQVQDIVRAHARAGRAMGIVRQNLAWAAGYNAVCIPLALVGWLPPWAAGLGMALSSLLVTLNALRAGR